MMTCKPTPRKTVRPKQIRSECVPPKPDKRLWEADKARAFEAGVQWFLAVSRKA